MAIRIYVPATYADLVTLHAEGRLDGPRPAHAVTPELVAAWPDGSQDDREYAAMGAAADESASLAAATGDVRRVVLAVDIAEAAVAPSSTTDTRDEPTAVVLSGSISAKNLASLHVDVQPVEDLDDDLAWFATQELPDLLSDALG